MQSGASRRTPVAVPAVRRRAAPTAPARPALPAADAATPPQVVLDLFTELNAIVVRASNRAIELNQPHPGAASTAELSWTGQRSAPIWNRSSSARRRRAEADGGGRGGGRGHHPERQAPPRERGTPGRRPERGSRPRVRPSVAGDRRQRARDLHPHRDGGRRARESGRRAGTGSEITVPLPLRGGGIGAVTVTSARPGAFSPAQAAALRTWEPRSSRQP